ncbi:molybdenum cofactor guanylyltransferase [Maribacter sp. HTCC2170]|uniref:molybdenum cofactor guanylyltransferase n=1 Tax=Maribacter sp. (strain HTCC2170 / KCCM 42371) TaxID=313603 RepID=UPI00006B48F1|nr:molybdenum cofactor guanylyltransferase [Maribacter sp. HTCC2170]EAR00970.1 bifunctional molybdenum cofactor biosynthesis protein [Maribacter sp. HTCC2170]
MTSPAKIYGLVLSGGKSTRMGTDKGLIAYHGIPQREYLYNMLNGICEKTFMSIRNEQAEEFSSDINTIIDKDVFKGPFNGLLSAHNQYPKVAWLVLACDLPLINKSALEELIAERDVESFSTAMALKENPLPEPLCAIWEPKGLSTAISYLEGGAGSCPRKFLINNKTKLVFPTEISVLMNANSKEEYRKALNKLAAI